MKISEVSKHVNLPISTIRYYEKMGIIPEEYVQRDENNYRNYTPQIIDHIKVVKNCLAIGFSINDIKSIIIKNKLTKEEQTQILQQKLTEIGAIQKELERSKQTLHDIIESDIVCEGGFGKINEKSNSYMDFPDAHK